MSGVPQSGDRDPREHDVDLAWELFEAQPAHPQVGFLARRILAEQPARTGIRMLLAMHLAELDTDETTAEARAILQSVVGQRDRFFLNAARRLRDLEQSVGDDAQARRWAEVVVQESQERGDDLMELGIAVAMTGDLEDGWRLIDDGVALVGSTDPDGLPLALLSRAIYLLQSFAPPERFIPAAEAAVEVDPSSELVGVPLAWAYMVQGRFEEAEQLCLRMLRLDPTQDMPRSVLTVLREWQVVIDRGDTTLQEIHDSGVVAQAWNESRAKIVGTDLASALAALETVLPPELRRSLRPPLDPEAASQSPGEPAIAAWHDGQEAGTGHLWGSGGAFRLMSSSEVAAMDSAVEADPADWPGWEQNVLADHYVQVMTDDEGGYLITTLADVVIRRSGQEDVVVAADLAGWFWDRVAAFGGRDPRPVGARSAHPG